MSAPGAVRPRVAAALALAGAVAAAGCDDLPPIPAEDLRLRISADAADVEFGRGFPLTVTRIWSKDLAPADWDDRALAPLAARLVGTERRENDRRVEETRRYVGHAFALGDVTLPVRAIVATPVAGGAPRAAESPPLHLRVRASLDPAAPGPPELPGGPIPEPFPWRIAVAGLAAVAAAIAVFVLRGRRVPDDVGPAPESVAPPRPEVEALARLQAVRERAVVRPEDYVEVSAAVRDYVTERFGIDATKRTTDEIVAAAASNPAVADSARSLLRDVGRRCDLVKFAAAAADAADRNALLDDAERFVRATA